MASSDPTRAFTPEEVGAAVFEPDSAGFADKDRMMHTKNFPDGRVLTASVSAGSGGRDAVVTVWDLGYSSN